MKVMPSDVQLCVRQIPFNEVRLLADCREKLILNYLTSFVTLLDQDNFQSNIAPIDNQLREDLRKGLIEMFGSELSIRINHLIERTMMSVSSFALALYAASAEMRSSMYN